jgi:hypothetical protein
VHALEELAGIKSLPQAVYVSLLRCSLADPDTATVMLQMPQAQHVTAGELCVFLATALQSSSPRRYAYERDDAAELMGVLLQ